MVISVIMICTLCSIFMFREIILKRHDWYLNLFPMIVLSGISIILSLISDVLSIGFAVFLYLYVVYSFTNKKARNDYYEFEQRKKGIYRKYKENMADNQTTFKDYVLPSGKKVEYIDFNTKTFYLLRPYDENVEKKYKRQIRKYISELETTYGGNWNYVIDVY